MLLGYVLPKRFSRDVVQLLLHVMLPEPPHPRTQASGVLSALWRGDGDRGGSGAGGQSSSELIRLPQEGK